MARGHANIDIFFGLISLHGVDLRFAVLYAVPCQELEWATDDYTQTHLHGLHLMKLALHVFWKWSMHSAPLKAKFLL